MDEKMGQTYINEEAANTLAARDYKQPQVVCYAIDHVICGGGTCTAQGPCVYEEVSPTMKSAGVHAVCYAVQTCGDRSNPSVSFQEETAYCIPSNPMSDREQSVCYAVDCRNATVDADINGTLQSRGGKQ